VACGVLFEMLVGSTMFEVEEGQMIQKIVQVNTKLPSFVKPAAWDLIQQLLMKKPEQRISLDNVLKSPWMVRNCPHQ